MPQIPAPYEGLIKQLMNVLLIEIRAERGFEFNVNLMRDPEAFADRRADADRAAAIIDQIRQDEASHVAYLQLFISELRPLHFKTAAGVVEGKTFIDPVWARIVAYGADEVPRAQQRASRELIEACLKSKPDGRALLERFDALGDTELQRARA
jgi:rubrerythrin